ncbi:MAG: ABC transporter permease [Actinobacteria bacterium]|nr:ABC transporter permease [Actinomycetota bacterium]
MAARASRSLRPRSATDRTRRLRAIEAERYGTLAFFLILFVVFTVLKGGTFASLDNVSLVVSQNSYLAFLACAVTLTLIAGQFDLSAGALLGLSTLLTVGLPTQQHFPVLVTVAAVAVAGLLAGLLNGILVVKARVTAFIATLGTGSFFSGLALLYSGGQPIYQEIPRSLTDAAHDFVGIPLPGIYAAVLLAVLWVLTRRTVVGRYWYGLGANPEAMRLTGVPVARMTVLAFAGTGLVAALGGIVLGARFGTASPNTGPELLLPAFAAAYLGSSVLSDGRFTILGSLLATYLIAFAQYGLQVVGLGGYMQPMFNGFVLVAAVALTSEIRRRRLAARVDDATVAEPLAASEATV